jgi:predicted MPP superfamily phosphohydrolase
MNQASFDLILWTSTGIDIAIGAILAFGPLRKSAPPVLARRLVLAPIIWLCLCVAKAIIMRPLGLSSFGLMHMIYLDIFLVAPILGAFVLLISSTTSKGWTLRRVSMQAQLCAAAAVFAAPIGIYASFMEPYDLRLVKSMLIIPPGMDDNEPIRVGVLADIQTDHVGDYERRAIRELMAQKPDLILLPGDLFQGSNEQFTRETAALKSLLSELYAPGGVYFVYGDVDYRRNELEELFRGTSVTPLLNETVTLHVRGRDIALCGVDLHFDHPAAQAAVTRLESTGDSATLHILMAHRPDVALNLRRESSIDLVVSGHTHGGQVSLPLYGPPITLSHVPKQVAAGGLHRLGGNWLYVSRGVGHERGQAPRIRFMCPPEISIISLCSDRMALAKL